MKIEKPENLKMKLAYNLDRDDLLHLLLGGELKIEGNGNSLTIAVEGIPKRDERHWFSDQFFEMGIRTNCIRHRTFDESSDGT